MHVHDLSTKPQAMVLRFCRLLLVVIVLTPQTAMYMYLELGFLSTIEDIR